jgi:hypothetical protein
LKVTRVIFVRFIPQVFLVGTRLNLGTHAQVGLFLTVAKCIDISDLIKHAAFDIGKDKILTELFHVLFNESTLGEFVSKSLPCIWSAGYLS